MNGDSQVLLSIKEPDQKKSMQLLTQQPMGSANRWQVIQSPNNPTISYTPNPQFKDNESFLLDFHKQSFFFLGIDTKTVWLGWDGHGQVENNITTLTL